MKKMAEKPKGVAAPESKADAIATTNQTAAITEMDNGDVAGVLDLQLSQETRDALTAEFLDALHQVQDGFGELTAPGKIFDMGLPFHVIDAATITDFEDQTTGEVKTKHVFRLEFEDGTVRNVMQSDARPRRVLASVFTSSRKLGARLKAGPYKYEKKAIPRQLQPAFIFTQQPGFKVAPVQ
jgi:hypothetical protein